ncbi:hypothetical protein Rs2_28354 [Raphanus sativus]|nr:hypothetical protein Rs2_28354 [Raphanus sativus]
MWLSYTSSLSLFSSESPDLSSQSVSPVDLLPFTDAADLKTLHKCLVHGYRHAAFRSTWFPSAPDALLRLAFFKGTFKLFEDYYYVKADDDIYLRPDRLGTLLATESFHL